MKKIVRISLLVLFVIVLAGTFAFLWRKTAPKTVIYSTVTPHRDTVRQFVIATGKVQPRDEVLIKPQISGIVAQIHVEAGTRIKKGDVIASIKVVPELGQLNTAESRVTVARMNLDQTQKESARTAELWRKGVVSDEEHERAEVALKKAKEEMQNSQDSYEIVKSGIANRYRHLSNTQIRATIDGLLLSVPLKAGNSVIQANTFNEGTTVASIADLGDMIFQGKVDETDVGRLTVGMPVRLTIGAMQGTTLDATLEYISPKAEDVNGVTMFEVKAAVQIPDGVFVRAGYSANASIVIENRENVLVIPETAVEFVAGAPFVYVMTSPIDAVPQKFEKRAIKTGLSDGMNIEVVEGLEEGQTIRGLEQQQQGPGQVGVVAAAN